MPAGFRRNRGKNGAIYFGGRKGGLQIASSPPPDKRNKPPAGLAASKIFFALLVLQGILEE
jgi:hypothetical protein